MKSLIIYNRTKPIVKWTKKGPILGQKYNINKLINTEYKNELIEYIDELYFQCDFYQKFQLNDLKDYINSCCVQFKEL